MLEGLGLNLTLSEIHEILFNPPEEIDFVFPLLNRAGFFSSEMLAPLLCEKAGLAYLGANPILRGLSDDKHLAKRAAIDAGVPTPAWAIFRKGAPITSDKLPGPARYVVKPNNSSASWGGRMHSIAPVLWTGSAGFTMTQKMAARMQSWNPFWMAAMSKSR